MKYQTIRLGRDYPGKIENFAEARNSFLERKSVEDPLLKWVLFLDDDEEVTQGFLNYLTMLPPPSVHYFWVRRVNLYRGRYMPAWNPDYKAALVSNRTRFIGRVHERIPRSEPHGVIDLPIIHNHNGQDGRYRNYWYQDLPLYRLWLATKKIIEVGRGR